MRLATKLWRSVGPAAGASMHGRMSRTLALACENDAIGPLIHDDLICAAFNSELEMPRHGLPASASVPKPYFNNDVARVIVISSSWLRARSGCEPTRRP